MLTLNASAPLLNFNNVSLCFHLSGFPSPLKSFSIPMFTNTSMFFEAAEYASVIKVFHLSRVDKPPIPSTSLLL